LMADARNAQSSGEHPGDQLVEQAQKAGETVDPSKLDPNKASIGVQFYVGSNKSTADSESHSTNRRGTNIQAANIDVTANEGNITGQGAKLQAQNIALDAAKDIKLSAADNTASIKSSNKSSSIGGGATIGLGEQSGISFQFNWGQSRGNANGSETVHDNTQVLASNSLSIKSGGNTELKGAQLAGKSVKADIGGDLKIETLQDQSQYESKQSSSGINISVCVPPICYGTPVTGSVSVAKTTIDHNYQSATGQSGIAAGEGGYDIKVAGNTDLKGGALTSKAAPENNSLQTKSLTFSDLENKQNTDVSASSFSAGYGGGGVVSTIASNVATNVLGNAAAKAGLPESGSEKSQTQSVISPGQVTITGKDEGGSSQQAANTLTSRDASTANGALKDNLTLVEAQDIQKNQQKAQDDIRAAQIVGSMGASEWGQYADKKFGDAVASGDEAAMGCWSASGTCRAAGHAAVGAVTGGTSGAIGAGVSSWTTPVLQDALISAGVPPDVAQALSVAGATGLGRALVGPAGAVAASNEAANNGTLGLARGAVLGSELLAAACAKSAVCVKLVGADALAAVLGTGAAALITYGDINPHVFGGAEVFEGQDASKQPTNTGNNKPAPSYGTNTGNTNPAPNYGTNTATPNNGPQQGGATVYPAPQGGEQGGNVVGGGYGAGAQPVVNPGVMASIPPLHFGNKWATPARYRRYGDANTNGAVKQSKPSG
jgi:filamentous hemagglutinin